MLRSAFQKSRTEVLDALLLIAEHPGVHLVDENWVYRALTLAEVHNVGFADAYIAASAEATG